MIKNSMNTNILKMKFVPKISYDLRGQVIQDYIRSHFSFQIYFFAIYFLFKSTNIIKTHIFYKMKYDSKDHKMSNKVSNEF